MRVTVRGDNVPDSVVKMYVREIMKAHMGEHISEVDITVEGGYMKVALIRDELDNIA